jgi:hypothetical protein
MAFEKKYNPVDFTSPLRENMQRAYDFLERGDTLSLNYAIRDVFFDIKEAIKFQEIDLEEGKEIQLYFMGLV